ncbi:UvrD-helicase domain-containing protein [Piscinibacter sp.]|uniref:UvrD-helicase domain-containing protein n=1 Tax=Piscinibacter sp. TaxID=1903157 RepID=UPI002C39B62C|nr:UvrD-helicase domain-containing protein [Albitalea sp.]HUG25964.1 UvrD-helicase domain-containing protein [Albitalea sp.]
MATFIPEWHKASGRELHVKRVLSTLDDEHRVRRPLRPRSCPADMFVEHRAKGWLAVALSPVPFCELDPAQLFAHEQRGQFEQRLAQLQCLGSRAGPAANGMAVLVVMWTCSTAEARVLNREVIGRYGVRLVSREQFVELGAKLVNGLLTPVPEDVEQHLLGTYFPETEIPAICTTRRFVRRENGARLTRFFLDHEQEWAAKLDLEMPHELREATFDFSVRLVNGVAGSGKTLIAIHRALLLAELFPRQRILLLIHNTPVVADLKERLHRTRGGLPANLEMSTFFAWIHQQWRRTFGTYPKVPDDPRLVMGLVQHHRMRCPQLQASDAQLLAELAFIDDALILDEAAYLAAGRSGRRFALRASERSQVWALHQAVTQSLQRSGLLSWSALPRGICLAEGRHRALQRYDHILVDEAQFFAPSWFQVVKLSLAAHGQLFLCADPNQGFLRNRLSWKSAGLDVAGRTKRLRRSYRTTRAILEASTAVLGALGQGDAEDGLEPDFAGMDPGTRPVLVYTDSPQDTLDRVVDEIAALSREKRIPLGAFLVLYGANANRRALHAQLSRRFGAGSVWWFNERQQKKEPPLGHGRDYLRMAYLDTATGLEGAIVFLIGMEELFSCGRVAGLGDEEQADRREENARKLYMAMTRAGQKLFVVSSQRVSAEMEALFDGADHEDLAPCRR